MENLIIKGELSSYFDVSKDGEVDIYSYNGERYTGNVEVKGDELNMKGELKEGKKNGSWNYYSPKGVLIKMESYLDGVLNGLYISYKEDGGKFVATYENGYGEGEFFNYYPNGEIAYKGFLKKGNIDGEVKYFSKDGEITKIENYKDNELNGKTIEYKFNMIGTPLRLQRYRTEVEYKDGIKQGEEVIYNSDGQILSSTNNTDGKKEGLIVKYHDNGKKAKEVYYKNGKKDGEEKTYYDDGALKSEAFYKDGKIVGKRTIYDRRGLKITTINY